MEIKTLELPTLVEHMRSGARLYYNEFWWSIPGQMQWGGYFKEYHPHLQAVNLGDLEEALAQLAAEGALPMPPEMTI
jgi:hypothetical protein